MFFNVLPVHGRHFAFRLPFSEMGTRVLGLGLESYLSPDLVGLGLDSRPGGLGLNLDSDFGTRTGLGEF